MSDEKFFGTESTFEVDGHLLVRGHEQARGGGPDPAALLDQGLARVGRAQLRRLDLQRRAYRRCRTTTPPRSASRRSRSSRAGWSCRTSRACRRWSTWRPAAARWSAGARRHQQGQSAVRSDLVIDHSVQVDDFGNAEAFRSTPRRSSSATRALRVPEVGAAGLLELLRRARRRRASSTRSTWSIWPSACSPRSATARRSPSPTRWWAPTRTPR